MRLTDILKKNSRKDTSATDTDISGSSDSIRRRNPSFSDNRNEDSFYPDEGETIIPPDKRPPVFKKNTDIPPTSFYDGKLKQHTAGKAGDKPLLPDETVAESIARGEDISEIYADAVKEARDIFGAVSASRNFNLPISAALIADMMIDGRTEFLFFISRTTADHYIYSHVVNVAAIASVISLKMGFPPEEVRNISAAAFLHDVGMAGMLEMVASKGRFRSPSEEITRLRQHPVLGQNIVERFLSVPDENLKRFISQAISQTHERAGGHGYPKGLTLANMTSEAAMIIAVADSYEAMTHNRSYREQMIPHEAIKTLINESEENFNPEVMKAFLTAFSLYPVGSYVRLSNNHIARILKIKENMPTRPFVRIIADQSGKKVAQEKKDADLEDAGVLAIKEAVDETKIKLEPKLSLELETQRWWIR